LLRQGKAALEVCYKHFLFLIGIVDFLLFALITAGHDEKYILEGDDAILFGIADDQCQKAARKETTKLGWSLTASCGSRQIFPDF
jgi:hypothetical protein